jgi:hypothetical protein
MLKKCSGRKCVSYMGRLEGLMASHSYRGAEEGIGFVTSQLYLKIPETALSGPRNMGSKKTL